MKHLLTAIACCLAVAGSAQFPYNPDADQDNLIGTVDLLTLLPLYGSEFNIPTPEVYQGSSLDTYTQVCYAVETDTCFIYPFTTHIVVGTGSYNNPTRLYLPWQDSPYWCHQLNVSRGTGASLNQGPTYYSINLYYDEGWSPYEEESWGTREFYIYPYSVHQYVPNPDCTQLYKVGD